MISVDIVAAPNRNFEGHYLFHKSLIYIGGKSAADIFCPDSGLEKFHFFIEIVEGKLILHIDKAVEFVLVNTKRTTHFKNLKIGDIIEVNDIKFKIIDFADDNFVSKREFLNKTVSEIENKDPELLKLISTMSNFHE